MNLLTLLLSQSRRFVGQGINHEGEAFRGVIEVQPLISDSALMLHYTATRNDGVHLHKEATLLASNAEGKLCLWPAMEELPFVQPHVAISTVRHSDLTLAVVFSSGPRETVAAFREEITFEIGPGGGLRYAHGWGMPGGEFSQRSSCDMVPA